MQMVFPPSRPDPPYLREDGSHLNGYGRPRRRRGSDSEGQSPVSTLRSIDPSDDEELRPLGSVDSSPEVMPVLPYWSSKRHLTCGNSALVASGTRSFPPWRLVDKLKTSNGALILCLNVDVDPPDVVKTHPCSVLECWVDPHALPSNKALEVIGKNLHQQFQGLNPRMKYKPYLDPSIEETRKFCLNLRKMAKEERALLYYNGHGVPKPTTSGELWVFNKSYSQYIPVSLYDIQTWMGSPCVYVWDCSAAGNLLNNFNKFALKRDEDMNLLHGGYPDGTVPYMQSIQLAACLANETLPTAPELPADLFTSCLSSPIETALRYFVLQHNLEAEIPLETVMEIPGDLKDRRTPLGELNWIFTAVTDTIAWTAFPRSIFRRLFRQDLLVAALFRNFLLAERIMKNYHCTPHTHPPLPPTHLHPMWASWDLAVEGCLRQLPDLIASAKMAKAEAAAHAAGQPFLHTEKPYVYINSRFFTEHLTAFDVWLSRGGSALTRRGPRAQPQPSTSGQSDDGSPRPSEYPTSDYSSSSTTLVPRKPPDQLPILLQVLLSQAHRLRALISLCQFVDLGPWAVHLALEIGIFPYVQKLLQSPAQELKPLLIFIWTRILAVDHTCQNDLLKDNGYLYFVNVLATVENPNLAMISNTSEHRAMCTFILAVLSRDFPTGQLSCLRSAVFENCLLRLDEDDFLLKQWACLCIGQMWDSNDDAKMFGVEHGAQNKLGDLLHDPSPEVRAAALFALGTFMGASGSAKEHRQGGGGTGGMPHMGEKEQFKVEVSICTIAAVHAKEDGSPMVRKELVIMLSCLVKEWRGYFVISAWIHWVEEKKWKAVRAVGSSGKEPEDVVAHAMVEWMSRMRPDLQLRSQNREFVSSFFTILCVLYELSLDPYPEVASLAKTVVDYIMALLVESPFARLPSSSINLPPQPPILVRGGPSRPHTPRTRHLSLQSVSNLPIAPPSPTPSLPPTRPSFSRADTALSTASRRTMASTIKRTSSFAHTLKNIASGYAFPSLESDRSASPTPRVRVETDHLSRPPSPPSNFAEYIGPYSPPRTPESHYATSNHSRYFSSSATAPPSNNGQSQHNQTSSDPAFTAADVISALIEEDVERLRSRRQSSLAAKRVRYQSSNSQSDSLPSPTGSSFTNDTIGGSLLECSTGHGLREILPLKSKFFNWSCEYFTEPQMRQAEMDEPGSAQYNGLMWRRQRNEKVTNETQTQAEIAPHCEWDRPIMSFQPQGHVLKLAFHSFDTHIIVSDEGNMITVWDWFKRTRINRFTNGNPAGTTITALSFINEDTGGLIVAGSSDGVLRMYRNYAPTFEDAPLQLATSWRALDKMIRMKRGSGLVLDWKQSTGSLWVGGDSRVIRLWDAHHERATVDLDTRAESNVTSIACDHDSSAVFLASFGDGIMKVFDQRLPENDAVVRSYQGHESWVLKAHWQSGGSRELLSAGIDGEVRLWDIRGANSCVNHWTPHGPGLGAFDVHEQTGVFAASSAVNHSNWRTHNVTVQSIPPTQPAALLRINILSPPPPEPTVLSKLVFPTGLHQPPPRLLPSPFIPSITSLAFHPTEMLFGVGCPDGTVRLTGCKLTEKTPPASQNGSLGHVKNQIPAYLDGLSSLPSIRSSVSS